MTINQAGSEIDKVNEMAGKSAVKVSADTFYVVETALRFASLSGGKFDLAIGAVARLWRIGFPDARVPAPQEIASVLALVSWEDVVIDRAQSTVYLKKPGMVIDLGGIAKGYAADEAAAIFRKHGVKSALVSLGGNVYAVGQRGDGVAWTIGVQDPTGLAEYVGIVKSVDETLVTSGAYERFLEVDGKRYHHILDPDTGYPSVSDLISATIVTKKSIDADALSTSVFILGRSSGLELVKKAGADAILIDKDNAVWVTPGIAPRLQLVNQSYRLAQKGTP
jgi:thiamine biosynthesis lipoprotein